MITPVPGPADVKRIHPRPNLSTDTIWTTGQVVTTLVSIGGSLIACALAYSSLSNQLEIQRRDVVLNTARLEKLETATAKEFREFRDMNASTAVFLVNIQRDVSEMRNLMERERAERRK